MHSPALLMLVGFFVVGSISATENSVGRVHKRTRDLEERADDGFIKVVKRHQQLHTSDDHAAMWNSSSFNETACVERNGTDGGHHRNGTDADHHGNFTMSIGDDTPRTQIIESTGSGSTTTPILIATTPVSSTSVSSTSKTTSKTTSAGTSTSSTTATTSSSSASAATSSGSSTGSLTSFQQEILDAHNSARSTHGASALSWSDELTDLAQTWANNCVWEHGGANGAGQNLASAGGTGGSASQSGQEAVDSWMAEESDYDPSNPTYSHFTQVVWKASTDLGCAQAKCSTFVDGDGNLVFAEEYLPAIYTVCNYSPAGNVIGEFADNVQTAS